MKLSYALALVTAVVGLANQGDAATISTLVNTGLDAGGTVLPDNAVEQHWSIEPQGGTPHAPIVVTSAGGFPVGPWLADSADSTWLSYSEDTNAPPIDYRFSLPFSLDGLDVDSVSITGRWSSDNSGTDILINGISTGQVNDLQFSDWSAFSISSAEGHVFNPDANTLTFVLNNAPPGDNPMGFRAEFTAATANPIPEPAVSGLALLALLMLVAQRRR